MNRGAPMNEETLEQRLDEYLATRLNEFEEQDDISLKVYYRVSPEFIAAVRAQRLELERLRQPRKAWCYCPNCETGFLNTFGGAHQEEAKE